MDYENYYSDVQLKNRFETLSSHFTGKMRDYLLTALLSEFYKKKNKNYDSLITIYHSICKTQAYTYSIDSLVNINKKTKVISEDEALNNLLENFFGKFVTIKNLISNRPIVIDCWASWCFPCLAQMEKTKIFEKKYKDKIDFIFLSFDKDKNNWIRKIKQLQLNKKNCYLLKGNFKSNFAQYFDISSIPRYIIINKERKIITANAVRPSQEVEFNKLLKNLTAK